MQNPDRITGWLDKATQDYIKKLLSGKEVIIAEYLDKYGFHIINKRRIS
jgi:hypothetical protein